jgi:hypothetical protein
MMLIHDIKKNGYYFNANGLEARHVVKISEVSPGDVQVYYSLLSGVQPGFEHHGFQPESKHFSHHAADGVVHYICRHKEFLAWVDREIPQDSLEAVEAISLSAFQVKTGIKLKLGQTYWSGGDCLRKVTGLTWNERLNTVEVRFYHLLGTDGRVSEECDDFWNDTFYLSEEEFLNRPTVLVNFGADALQSWLASPSQGSGQPRIFDQKKQD